MRYKQQLQNLVSRTTSRAGTAALAIAIVFALAVPALAQNAVPPTARQAAADPAFAPRLARQAAAQTTSKPRDIVPSRRAHASPQTGTMYNNGPYNGTTDAWPINFGLSVSNSFTGGDIVTGLHFVYWDVSTSDLLTTVDIQVGDTSFGGTPQTLTGVTNTFLGINQYGYALYQADYSFPGIGRGSYVTLSNACTTSGCSVSNPIYWDENSGVGCTSSGCPSTAYDNTLGSIPSEAFSLDSNCVGDDPSRGFKVIHNFTDQEVGPASGVAIDRGGNLYGSAWGGGYLKGMLYKLMQNAAGWVLNPLYSFAGGGNGEYPGGVIIDPNGRLYGSAGGGIQDCWSGGMSGTSYCGLVYNLKPRANACLTPPCSWTETTLYQFSGSTDAWGGGVSTFDQAGNLYGASERGGAYGQGAVYELTPSPGGWTEKALYSFTGGSDGKYPASLLMGTDGNLYGTTLNGGDPICNCGTVFQLVASGGGWTENVVYTFMDNGDGYNPHSLVQDSIGFLYGVSTHFYCPPPWDCAYFDLIFELSPGDWGFSVVYDTAHEGSLCQTSYNDLAIDEGRYLYVAAGNDNAPGCYPPSVGYIFDVYRRQYLAWFLANQFGNLTLDASGNIYGTTAGCGGYGKGTVWKLSR